MTARRFTLAETVDFRVSGEIDHENRLFLHLDLRRWSKSVYVNLLEALIDISKRAKCLGFKVLHVFVPESLWKFESMFGFTVVTVHEDEEHNRYLLMQLEIT